MSVDHAALQPIAASRGKVRRARPPLSLILGGTVVAAFIVVAIAAPWIAPRDPNAQELLLRNESPSRENWLGTDNLGRDVLSRLLYGARISLAGAVIAVLVAVSSGGLLGAVAGYARGRVDSVLSWIIHLVMSVPPLILAVTIIAVFGKGLVPSMVAVGVATTPRFYRIMRAQTQVVAADPFIESCRAVGCRDRRVVARHIVPNALPPVLVQIPLAFGSAITAEAGLSFLGLGIAPPTASWGSMLQQATGLLERAPYQVIAPGLAITISVLGFSQCSQGLVHVIGRHTSNGSSTP